MPHYRKIEEVNKQTNPQTNQPTICSCVLAPKEGSETPEVGVSL